MKQIRGKDETRCEFTEIRTWTRLGKTIRIFYHCRGTAGNGSCFCRKHDKELTAGLLRLQAA